MSSYIPGQTVPFATTFEHASGVPVNPTSPQVVLVDPNNVQTIVAMTNVGITGVYNANYTLPGTATIGNWTFFYQGIYDGGTQDSAADTFTVVAGPVAGGSASIALNSHALSTVPNVKNALGIPSGDISEDNWVAQAINAVSRQIENWCNRHFEYTTYTDELSAGSGRQYLILKNRPIVSISSIKIVDIVVTDYLTPTPQEAEGGMVFRQYGWFPGVLAIRQGLDIGDPHPTYLFKNITATYTAGYVLPRDDGGSNGARTLPEDLEQACIYEIDRQYTLRLAKGYKEQKTPVGYEVRYQNDVLSDAVKQMLFPYLEHCHGEQL